MPINQVVEFLKQESEILEAYVLYREIKREKGTDLYLRRFQDPIKGITQVIQC